MKLSRQEYWSGWPFSENTLILRFICTCPVFSIPFIEETRLFFFPGHEFEQTLGDSEGQSFSRCVFLFLCHRLTIRVWVCLWAPYLLHWSLWLVLCQYHTVMFTAASYYSLKSGSTVLLALFFCLKIVLAIQGLMWFHTDFRIIFSSPVKNVMSILIGITLNL